MPLGEFSIICCGFLSDFWKKSLKRAKRKSGKKRALSLQRRAPSQRRSPTPQQGRRAKKATPQVPCGIGTVHRGKIFGFCFRAPRICTPIV